jgi:ABC-type nitrate/sulfonate/bicarbonate transport system substrate-binding protein
MQMRFRRTVAGALTVAIVVAWSVFGGAQAADALHVGKPEATGFDFSVVDVGIQAGVFKKHGLDVEEVAFGGAAKQAQAMTAGSLDIALGSGTDMALIVKGVPQRAVAAMYGAPNNMCVIVLPNSPITDPSQMKGKKIAVSSPTSLTAFVAGELARRQGWGPNGVDRIALGSLAGMTAQLFSGNVDASVDATENAYQLQAEGRARILVSFGTVVPDFLTHIILASNELIKTRPEVLRRFLVAWFDTIDFMNHDKATAIRITRTVTGLSPELADKIYDEQMPMFSTDGRFDPKALAVVQRTFVDLGILDKAPDMAPLYTEAFLPPPRPR